MKCPEALINVRKILKAIGDIGVVVSEYGFADPEGTFHQWPGFDEFLPIRVKHAQVLQTLGGGRAVGPEESSLSRSARLRSGSAW